MMTKHTKMTLGGSGGASVGDNTEITESLGGGAASFPTTAAPIHKQASKPTQNKNQ